MSCSFRSQFRFFRSLWYWSSWVPLTVSRFFCVWLCGVLLTYSMTCKILVMLSVNVFSLSWIHKSTVLCQNVFFLFKRLGIMQKVKPAWNEKILLKTLVVPELQFSQLSCFQEQLSWKTNEIAHCHYLMIFQSKQKQNGFLPKFYTCLLHISFRLSYIQISRYLWCLSCGQNKTVPEFADLFSFKCLCRESRGPMRKRNETPSFSLAVFEPFGSSVVPPAPPPSFSFLVMPLQIGILLGAHSIHFSCGTL